tara:strand:- start:2430 stop:2771 length:342 start_codon:yes stop_codon:yes gene_type:complete
MYKIRGTIIDKKTEIIESKSGDKFDKMFITIEETDTGFNHKHQFEIFGKESIAIHKDNIKVDRIANIEFYIKSNEWKGKFFNTLNIKNIRLEDDIVIPEQVYDNTDENDDTPF